jgi:hypothetical protein
MEFSAGSVRGALDGGTVGVGPTTPACTGVPLLMISAAASAATILDRPISTPPSQATIEGILAGYGAFMA